MFMRPSLHREMSGLVTLSRMVNIGRAWATSPRPKTCGRLRELKQEGRISFSTHETLDKMIVEVVTGYLKSKGVDVEAPDNVFNREKFNAKLRDFQDFANIYIHAEALTDTLEGTNEEYNDALDKYGDVLFAYDAFLEAKWGISPMACLESKENFITAYRRFMSGGNSAVTYQMDTP